MQKQFFILNPTPQAEIAIQQAIEICSSNIYFLKNQAKKLSNYFINSDKRHYYFIEVAKNPLVVPFI